MVRLLLPAALILSLVDAAAAQINRRDREEPEMTIEAGGRTGTCDFLGFSSDGRYLYAAGDDKVVHVWPTGPDGLQILGNVGWRMGESLGPLVERGGRKVFVHKQETLEATPERISALEAFKADLRRLLRGE